MATVPIIVPYYENIGDSSYFAPDGSLVLDHGGHIMSALNFIRGKDYEALKGPVSWDATGELYADTIKEHGFKDPSEVNPFVDSRLSKEQLKLWLRWLRSYEEYSEYTVLFMKDVLGFDQVHINCTSRERQYMIFSPQPYSHIRLYNYYLMGDWVNSSEGGMLEWNRQKRKFVPSEPLIRSYTAEEDRYYFSLDQQYKAELINLKEDIPDKEKRLQYLKTGL